MAMQPTLPTPATGYAIVRFVKVGTTAGGIILPSVGGQDRSWVEVVVSSGKFIHPVSGAVVELDARPGDRVLMFDRNNVATSMYANHWGLPDDHFLIDLSHVAAVWPKEGKRARALGAVG